MGDQLASPNGIPRRPEGSGARVDDTDYVIVDPRDDLHQPTYQGIQLGGNAQAHLGDQYQRNHGVIINTTGKVELSDQTIQQLARLDLSLTSPQKTFGLCLGGAPQIEQDAFIGRSVELQQLQEWLPPNENTQKVVSIVGMGGLGKTQLSLMYARTYKDQYSSIFWINAKDELCLRRSFSTLASVVLPPTSHGRGGNTATGEDQVQVESVRRWLSEEWNNQWLIIFDNYDDPNLPNIRSASGFDIRSYFPYRSQGHILITTRSPKLSFSKRLMLQKFDSIDLGLAILAQRACRDLKSEVDAQPLAVRLDGLPLALATAGVYLGETGVSCTEYLQAYESAWSDLYGPESEGLFEYADRTLSSTWVVSFDQVARVDADAAELLKFWVYLSDSDVWYELIRNGADARPDWMIRVTVNKIRFDRAMTKLQDYSLARVIAGSYSIHPCVHDWLSEHFTADQSVFTAGLSCVVNSVSNPSATDYWMTTRRLLPHIMRLREDRFRTFWEISMSDERAIRYSFVSGFVLLDWGFLDDAEEMYMQALMGYEQVLGPYHTMTLNTVNNLGMLYTEQCRWTEAESMHKRALDGYDRTLKSDDPEILNTLNNLGIVYYREHKLTQAKEVLERATSGLELSLGRNAQSTLMALHNLGLVHQAEGRMDDAEETYLRVLAGMEEILGRDHPSTLKTIRNVGLISKVRGKLPQAEEMLTKALAGHEKVLGLDHNLTQSTAMDLGLLYREQGKLDQADKVFTRIVSAIPRHRKIESRMYQSMGHLASILCITTRISSNNPVAAKYQLARLIRLAERIKEEFEQPSYLYHLARALLWIKDDENYPLAFSQDVTAECDGCDTNLSFGRDQHVCWECEEVDLCSDCVAKYKDENLDLPHCSGHEYFDAGSTIPEPWKLSGRMSEADLGVWLDKLKEKYPLQVEGGQ